MADRPLAGGVGIVTGASRGLGRAFALDLAEAGAALATRGGPDAAARAGLSQLTACVAAELEADGIVVVAIGPAALTDMTRALWEDDVLPAATRQQFRLFFTADPDQLMRRSVELFRCVATGGLTISPVTTSGSEPGRSTRRDRSLP